jgi:hypothetical protein
MDTYREPKGNVSPRSDLTVGVFDEEGVWRLREISNTLYEL